MRGTHMGAHATTASVQTKVRLEHLLNMSLDAIIRGEQPDDQLTWSRTWSTGNLRYADPVFTADAQPFER